MIASLNLKLVFQEGGRQYEQHKNQQVWNDVLLSNVNLPDILYGQVFRRMLFCTCI